MDGTTLFVLLGALALVTIGLVWYSKKRRILKVNLPPYHASAARLFPELYSQEGITDEEMPRQATWLDGPNGRARRIFGVIVAATKTRFWLMPYGIQRKDGGVASYGNQNRRDLVRRKRSIVRIIGN